tara:strand:- start:1125 stop:2174 length:1050 start_codon:yes stop_codon:yes gene_type:complete
MIKKNYLISQNTKIKKAMFLFNKNEKGIFFIYDTSKNIVGIVTNGDIRKYILKKKINLDDAIIKIANKNFDYVEEKYRTSDIKNFFKKNKFDILPVIKNRKLIDIIEKNKFETNTLKIKISNVPVVIMIGGYGTRMRPYTNYLPKALLPVNGIPIISIILEKFKKYGLENFYLITHYKSNLIKALLKNIKKIKFLTEKKPLGTAGGLKMLKKFRYKNYIITNCDTLISYDYSKILKYHLKNSNDITIVCSTSKISIPFGVCDIDKNQNLKKITEKPIFENFINTGTYILNYKILDLIKNNQNLDMNELLKKTIEKKYKLKVYLINRDQWSDVGEWSSYFEYVKENYRKK